MKPPKGSKQNNNIKENENVLELDIDFQWHSTNTRLIVSRGLLTFTCTLLIYNRDIARLVVP